MPNHYYIIASEHLSDLEHVKPVILDSHPVGCGRALHRLCGATLHQAKTSIRNIPVGVDVGDHIYATTDSTCSNIVAIADICYQLGRRHFKYRTPQHSDSQYHLLVRAPLCRVSDAMKYEYVVGIPAVSLTDVARRRALTAYERAASDGRRVSVSEFMWLAMEGRWLFSVDGERLI